VDREEFTSFYAASFPRLVGQLYAMTGDRAEAQDAVQEAFVRAWVHRGQIDTDRGAEAWVRVTAWRIAASRWRRAQEGVRLMLLAARPDRAAGPGPDRVAFVEALRRVPAEQRRARALSPGRPAGGPDRRRDRCASGDGQGPAGARPGSSDALPAGNDRTRK
jgi:RNA polymerase sigma-70 factor (ECF subfamily)